MRHYETIIIINPDLAEEENREVIEKFSNLIEKEKGVIIKVDEWGQQRLAYEIKKYERGFYTRLEYCGDPGVPSPLERDLKLDDRILKYQTVKLADRADPEALLAKEKEPEKEPEIQKDPIPPDETKDPVPPDEIKDPVPPDETKDPAPQAEAEVQTQATSAENEVKKDGI